MERLLKKEDEGGQKNCKKKSPNASKNASREDRDNSGKE